MQKTLSHSQKPYMECCLLICCALTHTKLLAWLWAVCCCSSVLNANNGLFDFLIPAQLHNSQSVRLCVCVYVCIVCANGQCCNSTHSCFSLHCDWSIVTLCMGETSCGICWTLLHSGLCLNIGEMHLFVIRKLCFLCLVVVIEWQLDSSVGVIKGAFLHIWERPALPCGSVLLSLIRQEIAWSSDVNKSIK